MSRAGMDMSPLGKCAGDCVSCPRLSRPDGQSRRAARALYRCVTTPIYIYSKGVVRGKRAGARCRDGTTGSRCQVLGVREDPNPEPRVARPERAGARWQVLGRNAVTSDGSSTVTSDK